MKLKTTRFGEIEVPEAQVYSFPEGLLGFPDMKSYAILASPKGGAFQWMQSTEVPALAFVVTDPTLFFADFALKVRPEDLTAIQLADATAAIALVILTVPKDPREITANLMGPLVFNAKAKLARQCVQGDPRFSTKHKLFQDAK